LGGKIETEMGGKNKEKKWGKKKKNEEWAGNVPVEKETEFQGLSEKVGLEYGLGGGHLDILTSTKTEDDSRR